MKKLLISMLAVSMFASCSKEQDNTVSQPQNETVQFSVTATRPSATEKDTRASIEDFTSVVWDEGDGIAIYAKSYDASGAPQTTLWLDTFLGDTKNAIFRGEGSKPEDIDTYYAAYPEKVEIKGDMGTFEIPDTQDGDPAPIIAAKTENVSLENLSLQFIPINSMLHITLDQPVDEVIFSSCNDGEAVAGAYTYNYTDGTTAVTGSGTQISVKPADKTTFLISVPACTLTKGYRLTVKKGDKVMMQSYGFNSGKTFTAGESYPVNIVFDKPITVTLVGSVTTSYAEDGTVTKNNEMDGATVIVGGGNSFSGTISSALIAEAGIKVADKYYPTASKLQGGGTFDGCTATDLQFGNLEVRAYIKDIYGNYYLSANSKTAIVTGIPYSANPPSDSATNPWAKVSGNNISWEDSGVKLATITGAPSVTTPAFNIPEDLAVALYVKYTKNTDSSLASYIFTVSQYDGSNTGSEVIKHTSKSKGTYEYNESCTMSTQYNRFLCKYNYTVTGNSVSVNILEIKYQ